jgi:alkylation response protein AidB-like acyl-CoA dehydrogenase
MFTEAIESILRDACTPAVIRAVERGAAGGAADSAAALWQAIAQGGFLELMAPEAQGGAGLDLPGLFPILAAFGRHALPLPAGQSIAARALLGASGLPAPDGMITLSGCASRVNGSAVSAPCVPFGMLADYALVNLDGKAVLLDCSRASRAPTGVPNSQSAHLYWRADAAHGPVTADGEAVRLFSAAIHAAAIAGAMAWLFERTLGYCNDRAQFGKPIGKFQAVQHQLSVMAEHVAAAGMAAAQAFAGGPAGAATIPAPLPVALAKARTSMAVPLVAATAHALHGAIGITEEFDLQLYTRRLHEWRMAEGAEVYWNGVVGRAVLAQDGAAALDFVRAALAA